MKEYKGLYHNVQDKTKYFEYGAHFKYSELYNALNDLLVNQLKENPTSEKEINLSTLKIENKEEVPEKKRKKYQLKTHVTKNNRYLNTDANDKEDEKNKIDVIEEEQDNIKKTHIHKKNRFMTKSLDKVNLPQISSKSLISLLIELINLSWFLYLSSNSSFFSFNCLILLLYLVFISAICFLLSIAFSK